MTDICLEKIEKLSSIFILHTEIVLCMAYESWVLYSVDLKPEVLKLPFVSQNHVTASIYTLYKDSNGDPFLRNYVARL